MTTFYPPNPGRVVTLGATVARMAGASSFHPGGVNVLMGDGSSRFVGDSVQRWPLDPTTGNPLGIEQQPGGWWSTIPRAGVRQGLGTRAGGEVISADSY